MTDQKKDDATEVADEDLDQAQGAGAGVSPFIIQRNESDLQTFHGSDFNAAMGNSGHRFHGSDFNAVTDDADGGVKNANNGEGW